MKVSLIVATDLEKGIGKNNDLMWNLPADMQFFKSTTAGEVVVMGRKNYDSIPEKYRPLPNRLNVILTRNTEFKAENCLVFHKLKDCLDYFKNETDRKIFIIGGGQIYKEALDQNVVDEMFITTVNHTFDADTFFPDFDQNSWNSEELISKSKDEKNPFDFVVNRFEKK
jgi:dihydrofolate reductase